MTNSTSDRAILNATMEAAVDAIVVSDAAGIILRANPAASRLFGYRVEEFVGQNVQMIMPGSTAGNHDNFMSSYVESGVKKIIGVGREVEGKRKSGDVFPLHVSIGEAIVDDARIFVAILHDLTERIANDAALARSQRLDAIGQMTGGISHDFNNLLTVIIGNLELLEMQCSDETMLKLVREALQTAEIATELTSRLMLFARRGHLHPVETDLRSVCETTLTLLKHTLGPNIRISTDFDEDTNRVLVDPVQLESSLVNLAINARDAMPDGGKLLFSICNISIDDAYIAQETDVAPGKYVRLMISDDGEGMSLEAQKRAFEPFFTTKSESHGTGLGLAMVYGFVRQSGGHITLYSEIGHGTSVGLYFPAIQSAVTKTALERSPEIPGDIQESNGRTILVVEDNQRVSRITVERLRALGFQTLVAQTGDEAYEMLKNGVDVDLVFSDVVMPGQVNGYLLAEKVSAEFPDLKIMLTSGYASDVVTGKMTGGTGHEILHKPYHQNELSRRIHALLHDGSK